jgi:polyisoprenoid-binding protein YceI
MKINAGTYRLGPGHGDLTVKTGRTGAAAKAGHNLTMHVTSWDALVEVAEDLSQTRIELNADSGSISVREGVGGMQALGEDDKLDIKKTIDDEVLKKQTVMFRSTGAAPAADGNGVTIRGDLTLNGKTRPIEFEATPSDDGLLSASTVIKQSDFGMKPYSTLFGALKVVDEVEVSLAAKLPAA